MCYEASTMIAPGGIYVSVTVRRSDDNENKADDIVADDKSLTLSHCNNVGEKEKEDIGLVKSRFSCVECSGETRQSFTTQHGELPDNVLQLQSAVFEEDILYKMDAMHVNYLTILDDSEIETTALWEFLGRLALFEPNNLKEIVFVCQNKDRKLCIDTQCTEAFKLDIQDPQCRNGVTVAGRKEEFVPLLTKPSDSGDETEVKLSIGEHIFSGVRKLAQLVMDSLISVKTEDEDVLPYGETT